MLVRSNFDDHPRPSTADRTVTEEYGPHSTKKKPPVIGGFFRNGCGGARPA